MALIVIIVSAIVLTEKHSKRSNSRSSSNNSNTTSNDSGSILIVNYKYIVLFETLGGDANFCSELCVFDLSEKLSLVRVRNVIV